MRFLVGEWIIHNTLVLLYYHIRHTMTSVWPTFWDGGLILQTPQKKAVIYDSHDWQKQWVISSRLEQPPTRRSSFPEFSSETNNGK